MTDPAPTPKKGLSAALSAVAGALSSGAVLLTSAALEVPSDALVVDVSEPADFSAAMLASIDACHERDRAERWDGCRIRVPSGQHVLTETIVVCRAIEIAGDGGSGPGYQTRLSVAAGVTAIRVGTAQECAARGIDAAGGGAVLRDLYLEAQDCQDPNGCPVAFGVDLRRAAHVENVTVRGFTVGVHVYGSETQDPCTGDYSARCGDSNVNRWTLSRVNALRSTHAGVFVDGPDANAGNAWAVNVVGACLAPTEALDARFGECAAIVDDSFLGNTWIGSHTAGGNTGVQHRAFRAGGDSQKTTVVGQYDESNQLNSVLGRRTLSLGGLSRWDTPQGFGLRFDGQDLVGTVNIHNRQGDEETTFTLGHGAGPNAFWAASSDTAAAPLRLKVRALEDIEPNRSEFLLDVGNLSRARALGIRALGPDGGELFLYGDRP